MYITAPFPSEVEASIFYMVVPVRSIEVQATQLIAPPCKAWFEEIVEPVSTR